MSCHRNSKQCPTDEHGGIRIRKEPSVRVTLYPLDSGWTKEEWLQASEPGHSRGSSDDLARVGGGSKYGVHTSTGGAVLQVNRTYHISMALGLKP